MSLTPEGYLPRIVDQTLSKYLNIFGAISIEGPKWCGKTWTATHHGESIVYLMDPADDYKVRKRAELNPALILEGVTPRVIDEWQEVPGIWDAVRFSVDQAKGRGRYLLTGSVTPLRKKYRHSGAGRFAVLEMRSMSLFESGESSGEISLKSLFGGETYVPIVAEIDLKSLINITVRGGWPETLSLSQEEASAVSRSYLDAVIKNNLFDEETPQRNPEKLSRLLYALGRSNATTVNDSTLLADYLGEQTDEDDGTRSLSRKTMLDYLNDLKRIYIIEEIPAWNPNVRSRVRIRQAQKRIFTDPSLAIAAQNIGPEHLLEDLNTYGFMFENLCLRDLAIYSRHHGGNVFHYRDNSGLEADAIVEMPGGQWGAFEIKLGQNQVDAAAKSLTRLKKKMIDAMAEPPACLVVITGGGTGYQREDGISVVPITALGI